MKTIPVELTPEEIAVVVKWHMAQMKKVPKKMGEFLLKERADHLLPRTRALKAIHEAAKDALKLHSTRARELAALVR